MNDSMTCISVCAGTVCPTHGAEVLFNWNTMGYSAVYHAVQLLFQQFWLIWGVSHCSFKISKLLCQWTSLRKLKVLPPADSLLFFWFQKTMNKEEGIIWLEIIRLLSLRVMELYCFKSIKACMHHELSTIIYAYTRHCSIFGHAESLITYS